MPVRIHFKMRYHAPRRNGSTDVQQTNLFGKNISLFSSFRIHVAEIFSSVDEARHQAQERYRIVVSLRLLKLLLTTVKQRRLLMMLLTMVKQRRLLMVLMTTVKQRRLLMMLLTTVKQRRLLMLSLMTVKQRRLLMMLLTTVK